VRKAVIHSRDQSDACVCPVRYRARRFRHLINRQPQVVTMKLIAIRHGETEWNIQSREMGQLDSALTVRGIQQARAIAKRLSRRRFDALYCSDLGRAIRTAQIISAETGVEAVIDPGLRERNMGIFQGLTRAEMSEQFPLEYLEYRRVRHTFRIPKGESGQDRLARSIRVLTEIAMRHVDETVVVVTHGGFLMGFFEHVLGMTPGNGWRFRQENAAFNCFEHLNGTWSLVTWNETSHLDDLMSINDPTAQN
jgi:probable phosphoglycerate mutase